MTSIVKSGTLGKPAKGLDFQAVFVTLFATRELSETVIASETGLIGDWVQAV